MLRFQFPNLAPILANAATPVISPGQYGGGLLLLVGGRGYPRGMHVFCTRTKGISVKLFTNWFSVCDSVISSYFNVENR